MHPINSRPLPSYIYRRKNEVNFFDQGRLIFTRKCHSLAKTSSIVSTTKESSSSQLQLTPMASGVQCSTHSSLATEPSPPTSSTRRTKRRQQCTNKQTHTHVQRASSNKPHKTGEPQNPILSTGALVQHPPPMNGFSKNLASSSPKLSPCTYGVPEPK